MGKGVRKREGEGYLFLFIYSQNRMNESMHACLPACVVALVEPVEHKAYQNILVVW